METRRLVKGNHSRKTAAFVRACAAYCFITIPSLENILFALNLYLLSGQVALANGALSQGMTGIIIFFLSQTVLIIIHTYIHYLFSCHGTSILGTSCGVYIRILYWCTYVCTLPCFKLLHWCYWCSTEYFIVTVLTVTVSHRTFSSNLFLCLTKVNVISCI